MGVPAENAVHMSYRERRALLNGRTSPFRGLMALLCGDLSRHRRPGSGDTDPATAFAKDLHRNVPLGTRADRPGTRRGRSFMADWQLDI